MNKVILVGHLTKDPEIKYTQTGKVVATFTLAVNRAYKEKEADFIPIVVWGKVAEVCGDNIGKGSRVLIDGRLQVRSYEDKTGQRRWVTEVVAHTVEFLDGKRKEDTGNYESNEPEQFPDDDVPF